MGSLQKHVDIAKEKLQAVISAYENNQSTVVGDLATKVIEQLIEADASREGKHFGDHYPRHEFSNEHYPKHVNDAIRRIWFAYGDLGYDGVNGERAKLVIKKLKKVVEFFEERLTLKLWQE